VTRITEKSGSVKANSARLTVEIQGVSYSVKPTHGDEGWAFRLRNQANGKQYHVFEAMGRARCDCPDATFRRGDDGKICKHVRALTAFGMIRIPEGPAPRHEGVPTKDDWSRFGPGPYRVVWLARSPEITDRIGLKFGRCSVCGRHTDENWIMGTADNKHFILCESCIKARGSGVLLKQVARLNHDRAGLQRELERLQAVRDKDSDH
jgi:hypothetical protein